MPKSNNTIHKNKKSIDFGLKQLEKEFRSWRRTRTHHKEAIPENLWKKAIKLLKYHSTGKISSTLRLNHQKLKIKSGAKVKSNSITTNAADFIEVDIGATSRKSGIKNCLIELENAKGEQFKIHVNHSTALEHIDFIKSFLSK